MGRSALEFAAGLSQPGKYKFQVREVCTDTNLNSPWTESDAWLDRKTRLPECCHVLQSPMHISPHQSISIQINPYLTISNTVYQSIRVKIPGTCFMLFQRKPSLFVLLLLQCLGMAVGSSSQDLQVALIAVAGRNCHGRTFPYFPNSRTVWNKKMQTMIENEET